MKPSIERVDISTEELEALLERVRGVLSAEDYRKLAAAVHTLSYVTELLENRETTLQSLRRLLCQSSTEKTEQVLKEAGVEISSEHRGTCGARPPAGPVTGHGRNGAAAYRGGRKVEVAHRSLTHGDRCPECQRGKVYVQREPGVLVRMIGRAPVDATVYELRKLRCNLCGEMFTADAPEGVGEEKYDETSASMIALLKYGTGLPFHRLEKLERNLGIPLAASTQWEIMEETAEVIKPAFQELIREAAQGEVLHNDDTGAKVLALAREPTENTSDRTGVFTSGIVSVAQGRKIALLFTGRQHAGENLAAVLSRRAAELDPPIQMSDALSRNTPKLARPVEILVANCLAHGRRQFVEVAPSFPEECRLVLEALGNVYHHEALACEQGLSPDERMRFHQERSGPILEQLHGWLTAQLVERRTEPNSALGKAISYLLKYWTKLTLFLRQPGAPLDNNICERALKKVILHRKNALFYRTLNGAQVGDLFMSLIHTCELSGANPFDYLTELQRHSADVNRYPQQWMPWNYRDAVRTGT
jgi:transposase